MRPRSPAFIRSRHCVAHRGKWPRATGSTLGLLKRDDPLIWSCWMSRWAGRAAPRWIRLSTVTSPRGRLWWGGEGGRALDWFVNGDIPSVALVMVDGEVVVQPSRVTPPPRHPPIVSGGCLLLAFCKV